MTRSLPADFRQLRTMVEDRHQQVARRAMIRAAQGRPRRGVPARERSAVEDEPGHGIPRVLPAAVFPASEQIRADIDQILAQEFAREQMTAAQREELDSMLSTLLAAELDVQNSYLRWSASLRRFLTRAAHARHQRLLSLADRALHAGATWVQAEPAQRYVPQDVLGVGPLAVIDISQTQLWQDQARRKSSSTSPCSAVAFRARTEPSFGWPRVPARVPSDGPSRSCSPAGRGDRCRGVRSHAR